MKKVKITFWISTGLLSLLMVGSAAMYIGMNAEAVKTFQSLGYPGYLAYPLALAKLMGVLTIWFIKSEKLKEWTYAGFFFNFLLALFAHIMIADGGYGAAAVALLLLAASYFSWKKINETATSSS